MALLLTAAVAAHVALHHALVLAALVHGVEGLLLGGRQLGVELLHGRGVLGEALLALGLAGGHAVEALRRGQVLHLLTALAALGAVAARDGAQAALANASLLADAFGHVLVGWLWLDQALRAGELLAAGDARRDLLEGRRLAARYFLQWELPAQGHALALVARADRTVLDAPPDWL